MKVYGDGKELLHRKPFEKELQPVPSPADALPAPQDVASLEELYLAATHLEQYRHATYEPADYYQEGLRRDPSDIRLNNGYGLLLYRRGQFKESLSHFKAAVKKQTWKTPNPYQGEGYFNLGLALETLGRDEEAFDAFYKSTWSAETQSSGFFHLARLAAKKDCLAEAAEFAERSMIRNWHNMNTRTLKAALLRKICPDDTETRTRFLKESTAIDPLHMGCRFEQALLDGEPDAWVSLMREDPHNYLILADDYRHAGMWEEAKQILCACPAPNAMVWYMLADTLEKLSLDEEAQQAVRKAEACCPDTCFPNRVEEMRVLQHIIEEYDKVPMANYYLGNLLYDKKQYAEAALCWEQTVKDLPEFAMAWRNLSIYHYNKTQECDRAEQEIRKACSLEPEYPRFLLEQDQLMARNHRDYAGRLALLEEHPDVTAQRDDLYVRYITLLNCAGRYSDAKEALCSRRFHPWEGGEGKVSAQYKLALTQLARKEIAAGNSDAALKLLESTLTYPENLGEGKLPNTPDQMSWYYMGEALRSAGREEEAVIWYRKAAENLGEPQKVLYYNDQPSDYIYYQGLAMRALGDEAGARGAFHRLLAFGEQHLFDEVSYDYFAVSLPEIEIYQEDLKQRNDQYCNYLRALGHSGLGQKDKALELIHEILRIQPDHQGALVERGLLLSIQP